jgi:uncharacterized membrane protein YphA (DoxX/SURF4 family)
MKNIITQFSRIFVGILFIISGLIKLNDPIGFYKLAEYFGEPVFNSVLVPASLSLALFLVIVEVILGVMLLIYKSTFTIWSLLLTCYIFFS